MKLNNCVVEFLFDTDTPKTLISEEIWNEIRREDDVLNPVTSLFASCDGKPINVLGQAVCSVEGFGFMGDVDITVVQSLRRGCLLGKDISLKSKSIRSC